MRTWDEFAIGYMKGLAVGLYGLAAVAPVWAVIKFGLVGVLAFAGSYAVHVAGTKLWRIAGSQSSRFCFECDAVVWRTRFGRDHIWVDVDSNVCEHQ